METAYLKPHWQKIIKTKKVLKEKVRVNAEVTVYSESLFGNGTIPDGRHSLVGPGPYDRKWYAIIEVRNGVITMVIS